MNVASLLQDSPSDDRDTRLQRQQTHNSPSSVPIIAHPLPPQPTKREREREREKDVSQHNPSTLQSALSDYSPSPAFPSATSAIPAQIQMQLLEPLDEYHSNPRTQSKHKSRSGKSRKNHHHHQSQFELDWEVTDRQSTQDKEKLARLSSPAPVPPTLPSPALKHYNLGTFVYPHSPFPLSSALNPPRNQDVYFTLYIPLDHLPTSIPRKPSIWGGLPIIEVSHDNRQVTRRIYTDDSSLTLLPLHAGFCTLSDYQRPKGDLRVVFNVLLQDSAKCPIRYIGCLSEGKSDTDRIQSLSWGNGHDGGAIEIVSADWVKEGIAHRLTLPNRRARLQEYAERRLQLPDFDLQLSPKYFKTSPLLNDLAASKLMLTVRRITVDASLTAVASEIAKVSVLFEESGRIGFKYSADSLRHALFPLPSTSKSESSARPKKKRKVDRGAPPERDLDDSRGLEVETTSGVVFSFVPNSSSELVAEGLKQRKWDLQTTTNSTGTETKPIDSNAEKTMDVDPILIKQNIALADVDFLSDRICIWDPHIQDGETRGLSFVNDEENGRAAHLILKVWRWKRDKEISES